MIDVEVENFQSITKASIQIDGYTAIEGRSNLGKSALVRAIKSALTGAVGSDFVRHGPKCERLRKKSQKCQCFSTVRISTPTMKIVWEKGDEKNQYTITRGGETIKYTGLDRGDPEFLKPEFQQIQVGDAKDLIQVAEQWNPLFLLNKSGGVVADIIGDVAKLDDLNEASRLVTKDRKEAASTRTVREKDLVVLRKDLEDSKRVETLIAESEALQTRYAGLADMAARVTTIEGYLDNLRVFRDVILALEKAIKPTLPDPTPLHSQWESLAQIQRFVEEVTTKAVSVRALDPVSRVNLPPWPNLQEEHAACSRLDSWATQMESLAATVEALSGVDVVALPNAEEVISNTQEALAKLAPLSGWMLRLDSLKVSVLKYRGVDQVPDLDTDLPKALADVHEKLTRLDKWSSAFDVLQSATSKTSTLLQEAEEEEAAILASFKELGLCPTCEEPIGRSTSCH